MGVYSPSYAGFTEPYKFRVRLANAANSGNGASARVPFDTIVFDTGSNVDVTTTKGTFTAPIAGFYYFVSWIQYQASSNEVFVSIFKNGSEDSRGDRQTMSAHINGAGVANIVQLAASDTVDIRAFATSTTALEISTVGNYFSGWLVSSS